MNKSALQKARSSYQPKLPAVLKGNVKVVEGRPTQSVSDQEEIKRLFPNTYGMPELLFEVADSTSKNAPLNVGVILSGGQAPGGHNVISGLFDGIKNINKDSRLFVKAILIFSSDIATEFRVRGFVIHLYPLTFSEYVTAFDGSIVETWEQYYTYGGIPLVLASATDRTKSDFSKPYTSRYLSDVKEWHGIQNPEDFLEL